MIDRSEEWISGKQQAYDPCFCFWVRVLAFERTPQNCESEGRDSLCVFSLAQKKFLNALIQSLKNAFNMFLAINQAAKNSS
jgi:hypothetical protein